MKKYQIFLSENFPFFLVVEYSICLNRCVFVMKYAFKMDFARVSFFYFWGFVGLTGVYISFLILLKEHRLWVLVRTASPRRYKRVPTIYVLSRNMKKYQIFLSENFPFFGCKVFNMFE